MSAPTSKVPVKIPIKTTLVDINNCIGCRA
jgi:hypothetical protein